MNASLYADTGVEVGCRTLQHYLKRILPDENVYFLHLASNLCAILFKEEAEKRMHFTKLTHNQKIEAMWSQMMKQHNQPIKDDKLAEINSGRYDKDDEAQK
ncbi:hypothetical protein H4Q26_012644 [Puccinia striiformis f. sp. tritici PST-130]|nr:hypothetical protein H4Q26_012644 [Puccinia striiformis f. sp. tritici PST-130]